LPDQCTSEHSPDERDVRVRNQPGPFLNVPRRIEASRLISTRDLCSVAAAVSDFGSLVRATRLPLQLQKNPSGFSATAPSGASFVHIVWLLRSRPDAISLAFAPLLSPRDERWCARKSVARSPPLRSRLLSAQLDPCFSLSGWPGPA